MYERMSVALYLFACSSVHFVHINIYTCTRTCQEPYQEKQQSQPLSAMANCQQH